MALNLARYKAKHKEASETGTGGRSLRLKNGKNYLRIFKFQHKVVDRDFAMKLYNRGAEGAPAVGDVVEEISRPYFAHFMKGTAPQNCYLKTANCDHCQEANELKRSGDEMDKRSGRQLGRSERNAMNVVDMNNLEAGIQRFDASRQPWAGILAQYISKAEDGAQDDDIFGCNGRDFVIDYDKNADVSKIYTVTIRDKERCEKLDPKFEDKVVDLFRNHELDPVDAPPVGEEAPTPKQETARKPADPPPPPKEEEPSKDDPKLKDLKDEKAPGDLTGKLVSFKNDGKDVQAMCESQSGTVLKVRADNGELWEVDVNELTGYQLK